MVRIEELRNSAELLGFSGHFAILPYFDHSFEDERRFSSTPIFEILIECQKVFSKLGIRKPLSLVSYDAKGGYGHVDHVKVHELGKSLNSLGNVSFYCELTINHTLYDNWIKKKRNYHGCTPDVSFWIEDYGTPESSSDMVAFRYANHLCRLKKEAMTCHRSQMDPSNFPLSLND